MELLNTIIIGVVIFFARIIDVSIGTMRTISIVHGKIKTSFVLGFLEVSIWLAVISVVMMKLKENPYLGIFYAFGFATGNVVGIMLEKELAFGTIVLRLVNVHNGEALAERLREKGFNATVFKGMSNPGVREDVSLICRRKDIKEVIRLAETVEPGVIYTSEQAGVQIKKSHPFIQTKTGWRGIFKKK